MFTKKSNYLNLESSVLITALLSNNQLFVIYFIYNELIGLKGRTYSYGIRTRKYINRVHRFTNGSAILAANARCSKANIIWKFRCFAQHAFRSHFFFFFHECQCDVQIRMFSGLRRTQTRGRGIYAWKVNITNWLFTGRSPLDVYTAALISNIK